MAPATKVYLRKEEKGSLPVWRAVELAGDDAGRDKVKVRDRGFEDVVPRASTRPYSTDAERGVADMLEMHVLNEASIQHNMRVRHESGEPHTKVGSLLAVVNPYETRPIYGDDFVKKYASADADAAPPPHIFGIAASTYAGMREDKTPQAIVICGESGAGKTEATKHILRFLTAVDNMQAAQGGGTETSKGAHVRDVLVQSNPALEAFGNAKTNRNNNSSRFGKYFKVNFTKQGRIAGGTVTSYLLEKSRIASQSKGERNYHIFYQLCAGASPEQRKKYSLKDVSTYEYLTKGGAPKVSGMDDAKEFATTIKALKTVGLDDGYVDAMLRAVSAVLHLGNVHFEADRDGSPPQVSNRDALQTAASLLDIEVDTIENALQFRTMATPGGRARKASVYVLPVTLEEAVAQRDAFAKEIYGRIFEWLVQRISSTMRGGDGMVSMGVLDIFGFEDFEKNSFEQLCINYANEKLHKLFQESVLQQEMELYEREQVSTDELAVQYEDNAGVLEAIEGKGASIVGSLQAQCRLKAGSDENFLEEVTSSMNGSKVFKKAAPETFELAHYAGRVKYNVMGFLEKNKDVLAPNLADLFKDLKPEDPLTDIFSGGSGGNVANKTITQTFSAQLNGLLQELESSKRHFVRCFKPNAQAKPRVTEDGLLGAQLAHSGTLECARLRSAGYGVRLTHQSFVDKHNLLLAKGDGKKLTAREQCKRILTETCPPSKGEEQPPWQLGISLVFFKDERAYSEINKALNARMEIQMKSDILNMQRLFRGAYVRKFVYPALRKARMTRLMEEERQRLIKESQAHRVEGSPLFKAIQAGGGVKVFLPEEREKRRSSRGSPASRPSISTPQGGTQGGETARLQWQVQVLEAEVASLKSQLQAALKRAEAAERRARAVDVASAPPTNGRSSVTSIPEDSPDTSSVTPRTGRFASAPMDPDQPIRQRARISVRDLDKTLSMEGGALGKGKDRHSWTGSGSTYGLQR